MAIRVPARLALKRALKRGPEQRLSARALAVECGVKPSSVWGWVHGVSRPLHHHRLAIEAVLGIPASDWLTTEERRFVGDLYRKAG